MSIRSFDEDSYDYVQKHLRILSGLYGILRPFDIIQPYRLEMGTNTVKLINLSLYEFWSDDISKNLNDEVKINGSEYLFNLSSRVFSVLDIKRLMKIINFDFKIKLNDEYKNIGMQIKNEGAMAKFIIIIKLTQLSHLKILRLIILNLKNCCPKKYIIICIMKKKF